MERPRGLLRTLARPSASSSDLLSGPSVSDPSVGDLSTSDNQDTTIACTFRPLAQADELSGCSGGSHSPRLAQYASRESTLPPPERHEYHHADEEKFEDVVESSERADALLTGHDFARASASADATSLYPELDSITLGDVEVTVEEIESSERGDDHSEQHAGQVQNEKKMFLCIKGLPGSSFEYKQLRFLCKKLGVHGYKNKTKAAMITLIIQRKINEASYDALFQKKKKARSDPPQKQKQCPFRLLNVLFSDEFAGRLSSLGDTRLRADLDASMPPEVVFWRDVEVAFKDSDNVAYGRLAFQDIHPALEELDVNPAIIVNHCAEKLQQIWKNLLKDYSQPCINFRASGHHNPDFFAYCHGHIELLYLHLYLSERKFLTATVERSLSADVMNESEENARASQGSSSRSTSAASQRTVAKRERAELTEAIKSLVQTRSQVSAAKEKYGAVRQWILICDRLRALLRLKNEESDPDALEDVDMEIKFLKTKRDELALRL